MRPSLLIRGGEYESKLTLTYNDISDDLGCVWWCGVVEECGRVVSPEPMQRMKAAEPVHNKGHDCCKERLGSVSKE
jgi:hypothetical protein